MNAGKGGPAQRLRSCDFCTRKSGNVDFPSNARYAYIRVFTFTRDIMHFSVSFS